MSTSDGQKKSNATRFTEVRDGPAGQGMEFWEEVAEAGVTAGTLGSGKRLGPRSQGC